MPQPSKHHRETSDRDSLQDGRASKAHKTSVGSSSHSGNAPSPATLWDLPLELRSIILDLACQRPYKESDEADVHNNGKGRLRLDVKTVWSLALVSRSFNAAFTRTLYSHVKLVTPTELANFRRALVLKPGNSLLVKSIHIGPLSDLPTGWWPLRCRRSGHRQSDEDEPTFLLKTSWTRRDAMRPRWCKPRKEWAYGLPARTCYGRAVGEAIKEALEGVGVGLDDTKIRNQRFFDADGNYLGMRMWTSRLYEVQAILDLYLAKMRQIEDEDGRQVPSWRSQDQRPGSNAPLQCRTGKCKHYPHLRLKGFSDVDRNAESAARDLADSSSAATADVAGEQKRDCFEVDRQQVIEHLERRGGPTDHFDHPLLFARSRRGNLSVDDCGRVASVLTSHDDPELDPDDLLTEYNDDDFSQEASLSSRHSSCSSPRSSSGTSPEPEIFTPINRDEPIALTRSVLRLTRRVQSLSLTGYLDYAIHRSQPQLSMLRSLSLGPTSPQESAPSCLMPVILPAMTKLRVCGNGFGTWAAGSIGVEEDRWPALREIQWDFGALHSFSRDPVEGLFEEFDLLHGRSAARRGSSSDERHQAEVDGSAHSTTCREEGIEESGASQSSSRYIEVRLHPHYVAAMLEKASPAQREAWVNGTHVADAPHRVRLLESRAAKGSPDEDANSRLQDFDVLRKGSMQWWEEEAWELERGELPSVSI